MLRRRGSTFTTLRKYILREFGLSLLVAFLFFFFIFAVNQLLLFAQKIILKNVDIISVVKLVALAIPQILLYTIPFSTLSAASMVIGDKSATNEILALRAAGISLRRLFEVIAILALLLSLLTFLVADVMLPYSHIKFKTLYSELLQELPTLEIEPYAVNTIGETVLVTTNVEDGVIETLVLFDTSQGEEQQIITAKEGRVTLVDLDTFLYRLDVKDPVILNAKTGVLDNYALAEAESMTFYLDFSSQVTQLTDVKPSQLSSRDLMALIETRELDLERAKAVKAAALLNLKGKLGNLKGELDQDPQLLPEIVSLESEIISLEKMPDINFYLQYYRSELHKKFALAASCFILVFITFPLSFMRLKHGRLFGFGLSLFVAACYWFMLFFAQKQVLNFAFNPAFLIWAPNFLIALLATILLIKRRRL